MFCLAVLAFTLLIPATVGAGGTGGVSFRMDNVTLTCPGPGDWFKGNNIKPDGQNSLTHQYKYTEKKDQFYCKYSVGGEDKKYHFYIQGKTCGSCFELDALLFAVIIIADVIGTTVVMVIVYKCSKKTSGGPQKTPNPTRPRDEIPMTSPYEALNPRTRSHDEYAGINPVINRTG